MFTVLICYHDLLPWIRRSRPCPDFAGLLQLLGDYSMQIYLLANPVHDFFVHFVPEGDPCLDQLIKLRRFLMLSGMIISKRPYQNGMIVP